MELARDQRVLEAMARLKGDADFDVLVEAIKEELSALHRDMTITREETPLRWMQGAAQTLSELLDLIGQSADIVYRAQRK